MHSFNRHHQHHAHHAHHGLFHRHWPLAQQHHHHRHPHVGGDPVAVQQAQDVAMHTLNALGWVWHQDGVVVTVVVDQHPIKVFVPAGDVWIEFKRELAAVGCPMHDPPSVGAPLVEGLFSSIKHAVSSVARAAASVVPAPIRKAATAVVNKAAQVGKQAIQSKYFRYALDAAAVAVPALAPAAAAVEAAHQAMQHYQEGMAAAKRIAAGVGTVVDHAKVALAHKAHAQIAQAVADAKKGDPRAQQLMGALKQAQGLHHPHAPRLQGNPFLTAIAQRTPGMSPLRTFLPRYT